MAQDGSFGAVASGAASGAGMGSSIGGAIGTMIPIPGAGVAGTALGAQLGAIAGGVGAGIKHNKAKKSQDIPIIDPQERVRLAQLDQISKNLSSGSDVMTKQNVLNQKNIGRAAQNAISKSTGGDVGGTIDALLKSQKATQGGINQAIAQSASRLPYFQGAADQLRTRMSQRRLELDLLKRSQETAENAQARTDNNVNAQALLGTQGGTETIPEGMAQVGGQLKGYIGNMLEGAPLGTTKGANILGEESSYAPGQAPSIPNWQDPINSAQGLPNMPTLK